MIPRESEGEPEVLSSISAVPPRPRAGSCDDGRMGSLGSSQGPGLVARHGGEREDGIFTANTGRAAVVADRGGVDRAWQARRPSYTRRVPTGDSCRRGAHQGGVLAHAGRILAAQQNRKSVSVHRCVD